MATMLHQKLPLELILHIVDLLTPQYAVALRPDDPTAQCIRAFTLVCRATYPPAMRLLYKHCLYIDSSERLRQLLVTLNHKTPSFASPDFPDQDKSESEAHTPPTIHLPPVDIHPYLQNLYLAPFKPDTIDDLPTAEWIFELFCITRHTLRRLISGMPTHTLSLWRDHLNVRTRLRAAFSELTHIEEFVSLYDDLDLLPDEQSWLATTSIHSTETPVWLQWSHLRRLSLRKCNMYRPVYGQLEKLPHLQSVVMVASMCFEQEGWNKVFENFSRGRDHEVTVLWPATPQLMHWTDRYTCHGSFLERIEYARAWNERRAAKAATARSWMGAGGDDDDQSGRHAKVNLKALAVDDMYAPGEQRRGLLHLQTWITDRAIDGTLFEVGEGSRYKRSSLDADYWVDAGRDGGRWMDD